MIRFTPELKLRACKLREAGRTFKEIKELLGLKVPKSTLSYWCRKVSLPTDYGQKIRGLNLVHLKTARNLALAKDKIKRKVFLDSLDTVNLGISKKIFDKSTAKIALAMLCLGEASKYRAGRSPFALGSSDPRIIILFIELLKLCFDFKVEKIRCTVQCRSDQDILELEKYWQGVTGVPKSLFYKTQIDTRTIGKPTRKAGYKGVLKVDYFNSAVQLELESLANLVYNHVERARSLTG